MKYTLLLFAIIGSLSLAAQSKKRITVAQDGSGDFKTVQAAIDAVPPVNTSPVEIYIKKMRI
jgi:pectinesterase